MALTGDFRDTQFADLIQFYGMSRQSVAVSVRLGVSSGEPDGVFYFEGGDLVAASLAGAEGREAVRRALRLREGSFTVAAGAPPSLSRTREPWKSVVLEELVRLDEEDRARRSSQGARAAGATATGPAVAAPAEPPRPRPGLEAAPSAGQTPPARGAEEERGGPPAGASPPPGPLPKPPRRSVAGKVLLAVGGAAAVVLGATVSILLSPPAQQASQAVQQLIEQPAVPRVRGVTDDEVVLGMASPFTGANRELGRGMKEGVEAAFAEVNAAGGVHGRRLRLVALDDGYEPSRTGPVMRQLVEGDKVFAVVGNVGTPTAAVSIPYITAQKVVFFGAFTGGDLLRKDPPDRYVFNFRPSYAEETSAAVRWLVGVRRVEPTRIAVLSQDDEFGESGWRGAARQLEAYGVDPAKVTRVRYRRNTADVGDAVATLRARGAEVGAVVMVATYKAAATFVRKARDAGLGFVVTNVSAVDASALSEELVSSGARYAKDVMVTQIVPLPTSRASAVLRYQEALAKYGAGARAGFVTLEGWIVGHLFAEGLRRAGREVDTEKLVGALEAIDGLDLGIGAKVAFGPREHQGSHKVWATALQPDGSYRQIDLE